MVAPDTIAAIATPPQSAAIGIIRLSGPASLDVIRRLVRRPDGQCLTFFPRSLYRGRFFAADGEVLDEVMAVYFAGPKSYTGENAAEIHAHGNPLLLRRLLREILALSLSIPVRAAEAGEFTRRAFLNGRMDLARAESVHALITAESDAAIRSALSNLDGALSRRIQTLRDRLLTAMALVEAGFEFSEEESVATYDPREIRALLEGVRKQIEDLTAAFRTSQITDRGLTVALVGAPNVGKSSLMNTLLVSERSIVTDIPGTTRDVVEGAKLIGGVRFIFRDTAGIHDSAHAVEREGVIRARRLIEASDIVLWITDRPDGDGDADHELKPARGALRILNKADLLTESQRMALDSLPHPFDAVVSAVTGDGLEHLERLLEAQIVKGAETADVACHVNERQHKAIASALEGVREILAGATLPADEVLAEELRHIADRLGEVTGAIVAEDVLGGIFDRFCIGK